MSTKELIGQAQERKYTEFDIKAKEMLQAKVAEKMQEKGYFDRLDIAKNVTAVEENLNEEKLNEEKYTDKKAYDKIYKAELAKFEGAKSPADLSTKEKVKFFDAIDAAYVGKDEKPEAGDK